MRKTCPTWESKQGNLTCQWHGCRKQKNGLLDVKKPTRQRLGFRGEKVRDKEDGGREFLLILKLLPAQNLISSMPDLIFYWPRATGPELICVDDIILTPGTDSSDGCGPLGLSGHHVGSNIVGRCRCLCLWIQGGTAGQEEGEGWQEEARGRGQLITNYALCKHNSFTWMIDVITLAPFCQLWCFYLQI